MNGYKQHILRVTFAALDRHLRLNEIDVSIAKDIKSYEMQAAAPGVKDRSFPREMHRGRQPRKYNTSTCNPPNSYGRMEYWANEVSRKSFLDTQ